MLAEQCCGTRLWSNVKDTSGSKPNQIQPTVVLTGRTYPRDDMKEIATEQELCKDEVSIQLVTTD